MLTRIKSTFKKYWYYLPIPSLFLTSLLTAFLLHNRVSPLNTEALLSYGILLALGIIPGLIMVYAGNIVRSIIISTIIVLFIFSQINQLPDLPYGLNYKYVIIAAILVLTPLLYILRDNLGKFIFIIFSVIWLGAFFTPSAPLISSKQYAIKNDSINHNLPAYIHIVLDEHIGVEGIASQDDNNLTIAQTLKNKYIQSGFKVYGKAYSRYAETINSFPSFLNLKPIQNPKNYIIYEKDTNHLTQNHLFETLSKKGYQINVIQSYYLDFCKYRDKFNLKSCTTYQQTAPIPDANFVSTHVKSIAILNNVFEKLLLQNIVSRIETSQLWHILKLPDMTDVENFDSSTAAYGAFSEINKTMKQAEPGNAYFIHLLLPHRHYVYDAACHFVGDRGTTTKYYLEQLQCTQKLMDQLLATLSSNPATKNSIIIIQGDHGSRVQEMSSTIKTDHKNFTPEDFIHTFSTFFAVKSPEVKSNYDKTPLPIDYLLKNIVLREQLSDDQISKFVYLLGDNSKELKEYSMPEFEKGQVLTTP